VCPLHLPADVNDLYHYDYHASIAWRSLSASDVVTELVTRNVNVRGILPFGCLGEFFDSD
jgi:hypothetical protein